MALGYLKIRYFGMSGACPFAPYGDMRGLTRALYIKLEVKRAGGFGCFGLSRAWTVAVWNPNPRRGRLAAVASPERPQRLFCEGPFDFNFNFLLNS